mgnify:CR=1 FL=1
MNEPILVSACLLGVACRYDGQAKLHPAVAALMDTYTLIPFCPEVYGGLPTPREPAELQNGRVATSSGRDVTDAYRRGAQETLTLAMRMGCRVAILKERSPSCGKGTVHDGRFQGGLVPGNGVTAALLMENGLTVYGETDVESGAFPAGAPESK